MNPNNYVGKDFLSMPKAHHHVSRLLILIIILLVIAAAAGVWAYLTDMGKKSPAVTSTAPHQMTNAERIAIIEQGVSTNTIQNPTLTNAQRIASMNVKTTLKVQN